MFRALIAASAALVALGAYPFVPQASAAEGDQTIRVQDGKMRCLLTSNYEGRGRATAICGLTDGAPFGASPWSTGKNPVRLTRVLVQGTGEMWWEAGTVPGSAADDVVLGVGQTYSAAGWTVTTEDLRTVIKNDDGGHGILLNPVDARQF